MSSTETGTVAALLDAVAGGSVEIVDLTQPLSESTPVIKLPPPFVNTPGLSREEISHYDDRGPAWAWYTLTIGEHVGTHLDAPIHWVTGKDGADVGSITPNQLIGPACVIDKTFETDTDNGYLLTVADLEAWEGEHGRVPDGAWVLFRTGWGSRANDEVAFLNAGPNGPKTRDPTSRHRAGSPTSEASSGSALRQWGSTPAPPAASTHRSRCTTSCSGPAASASPSWPISTVCRSPALCSWCRRCGSSAAPVAPAAYSRSRPGATDKDRDRCLRARAPPTGWRARSTRYGRSSRGCCPAP